MTGLRFKTLYSNNWQPRHASQWQRERASGPLLPMLPEPRRGWWTTDYGRPGGLLAYGLNRLRRFRGAASLTRRAG